VSRARSWVSDNSRADRSVSATVYASGTYVDR